MECTFCGKEIQRGTGIMYVKKDGKVFHYCFSKCEKNHLKLKRVPRHTLWTKAFKAEKKAKKATKEAKK